MRHTNPHPVRSATALAVALALVLSACSSSSGDEAADTSGDEVATTVDATIADGATAAEPATCEEVAAAFATKGSANDDLPDPEVSATCEGDVVVVTSNAIPDYTYIATTPGQLTATEVSYEIPVSPTEADETTDVPLLGAIGVAIDGVPIYGATEGTGGDVLSLDGALSECGSHNGPTGFHIHLFGTSDSTDCLYTPEEAASEPQLLGYAFDGYPIYTGNDQYTSSWELVDESLFATDTWDAHAYVEGSGDLDECNGLVGEDGSYAYYTTDTFPYTLGCYRGDAIVPEFDPGVGGGPP
ncbi:MAG: YHYH protein [Acidimicrobiales bacterium]|nr:YHYH protein [Acidimicrobiales bacterium]